MSSLRGQVALITGASSGIGRAVALAMGRTGADIVVNYVKGDAAAGEVVEEVKGMGRRAIEVKADVSDETQVQSMFTRAVEIQPDCVEALKELRLIDMRREKKKGFIGRLFRR